MSTNLIRINAQGGTMTLDGDALPTNADMTDIISSLTRDDDDGAEFQALCDAATALNCGTTEEFYDGCKNWLDGYRRIHPLAD